MTRSAPHRFSGILAVLCLLGGCADVGPELGGLAEEVAQHRRMWEARGQSAYVYELERQCFCGVEARGPVRVTVEGNQVTGRIYSDSGGAVPEPFAHLFPTVDGLFDILEDALARSAERVEVTWDDESGFPWSFFIDYSVTMADEELGYSILSGPS